MNRFSPALLVLLAGPACRAADAPAFPPLPVAVSSFGACAAGGHLYVYGGHSGKTHTYSTEAVTGRFFRIAEGGGKEWEELPSGPACQGLALVAYKGKVYRIGGMQPRNKPGDKADNHSLASCSAYDPRAKKWADLPALPAGRSSHDAAVVGGKLYVVGGWTMKGQGKKSEWLGDALSLDLEKPGAKWESIKQPFQRRALQAASLGGKLYVFGGMDPDADVTR